MHLGTSVLKDNIINPQDQSLRKGSNNGDLWTLGPHSQEEAPRTEYSLLKEASTN